MHEVRLWYNADIMPMSRSEAGKLGALKALDFHSKNRERRLSEYKQLPKLCKTCNAMLPYKKRYNTFCDHTCAARNNNVGIRRNGKPWAPRVCASCGSLECKRGRKYCPICIENKKHLRCVTQWSEVKTSETARKLIILDTGHKCSNCGNSEWIGVNIPLEINHKDGNADNWERGNIELICPNCHALTPNYKSRNKNRGSTRQQKRRERYAAGKTY